MCAFVIARLIFSGAFVYVMTVPAYVPTVRSGVSVPGLSGWCVMILRLFYSELVSIPHGGSDMIYLFVITISLRY